MNLRPRKTQPFSGFTEAESAAFFVKQIEKMEQLFSESTDQSWDKDFCKKMARVFSRSSGRAGKPILKWTEIQNWFQAKQESIPKEECSHVEAKKPVQELLTQDKVIEHLTVLTGEKSEDIPKLEFEAKSPADGAWYDVDAFLAHKCLSSGEIEVHIRYVGFGAEEDEWVNLRHAVRERSVSLEDSECQKVQVGNLVVCLKERQDDARYYDAHVLAIQRKLHDIRGCRCLFFIRYDHDSTKEKVRLSRLCCRPELLQRMSNN